MSKTKPDHEMKARYRKMRVNGIQVNVCRYVMEQKLGRQLEKGEYVHHINGNKLDDRQENLALVSPKEHAGIHNQDREASPETRLKMSIAHLGKKHSHHAPHTLESNLRRSETMKRIRRDRFWSSGKKST